MMESYLSDPLVHQYLKSIESTVNRVDARLGIIDTRVNSLETTRTEQNATVKAAKYFAGGISAIITVIFNVLHKGS